MTTARNTPPPAERSDIVESELMGMLQTVVDARRGLSAIHRLLDEAKTMVEIRARFAQWQANPRENGSATGDAPSRFPDVDE
ncbi:MAG: hypothetical protein ACYCY9_09120 [Thiobacillus sp.]